MSAIGGRYTIQYNSTTPRSIPDDATVTFKIAGHTYEIIYSECQNIKCNIRRIDKTQYVDLRDGEVHDFNQSSTNRGDNIKSLKRTMAMARDRINANCTDPRKVLFVTLTYKLDKDENGNAIPMRDTDKLRRDLNNFYARFKRKFGDEFGDFKRISCLEPQGSGSWHAHILFFLKNQMFIFRMTCWKRFGGWVL